MTKGFYKTIIPAIALTVILSSCHRHGSSNPYVHMKVKPNERQMREDKKALKRSNRNAKKMRRKTHKRLYGTPA